MITDLSFKNGDVYKWSWNEVEYNRRKDLANLYWCESRIGIVDGECLVDTFWSGGSNSRCFDKNDVLTKLDVQYLGNLNDYQPCRKEMQAMYDDKDFLDLSHSNNGISGAYYLRKDATKSKEKMVKIVKRNALLLQYKVESAKRALEWELTKLRNSEEIDYAYGLDGVSLSDESYVDEDFYLLGEVK
ncbi:MAG: hypothetical protein RSB94_07730 [Erysipelotrichaceae bacterium]